MGSPSSLIMEPDEPLVGLEAVLNALPDAILVANRQGGIVFVNLAAEDFFASSSKNLRRFTLFDFLPKDSPLLSLFRQVIEDGAAISEYEIDIGSPRITSRPVDIRVAPVIDYPGYFIITLQEKSIAQTIDRQLTHRGAARSVMGLAAVLAHEIKNPLSGIRGAAQLLETSASSEDRELTQLICEETDRICALVDRMETFSDHRPIEVRPVNIHQVLEHVRKLASTGFAHDIPFTEIYDPSLPAVMGDKGQLIQVFLNLVKNAAEAIDRHQGEITLTSAYRHGIRIAVPGRKERTHLPIEVCVIDNGPGVPDDLRPHLFDPFVTTKNNGTGLGLALVAKIIGDHGGIVECESRPRRTMFRVLLPAFTESGAPS